MMNGQGEKGNKSKRETLLSVRWMCVRACAVSLSFVYQSPKSQVFDIHKQQIACICQTCKLVEDFNVSAIKLFYSSKIPHLNSS